VNAILSRNVDKGITVSSGKVILLVTRLRSPHSLERLFTHRHWCVVQ